MKVAVLRVNEVLKEMRKDWTWGWVKWDASNSCEVAAEYDNRAEFNAAWETAKERGERCSFYRCPLCKAESSNPLDHLLSHDETVRVWVDCETVYIYLPGSRGPGGLSDPIAIHIGKYHADSDIVSTVKRFLRKEVGFAELKAAVE